MTGIEIGVILGGAALVGGASGFFARRKLKQKLKGKIFGKDLSVFKPKKLEANGVLKPVEAWIKLLETQGAETKDIFKNQATNESVLKLYEKIVNGSRNDSSFENEDIFVVAGILQVFLRELPECLLTNYSDFIQAEKSDTEAQSTEAVQQALNKLSTPNVLLLKRILEMCRAISHNSTVTEVKEDDLAETLSPCLMYSADPKEAMELFENIQHTQSLISKLIKEMEKFNFSRLPSKASLKKSILSRKKKTEKSSK